MNTARRSSWASLPSRKSWRPVPIGNGSLLLALARYGGLRTPSEPLALEWNDVNWERDRFRVVAPKTEHQDGGERWVPLFPELRPFLEEAFEWAAPGTIHVVTRWRDAELNLRTGLLRTSAGRREGMAAALPEPALLTGDRTGGEVSDSRCRGMVGQQPQNCAGTLHAGYRGTLPAGAAKSGAAPCRTGACTPRRAEAMQDLIAMPCKNLRLVLPSCR